jgi:hypothetical protein
MQLSVIICTHNPRQDYLRRTLEALKLQSLPKEQWELLLIDNISEEPLEESWDLSWHPNAHHIREEELGLTPARFRGIREASSEILIFVDDDNVLSADYLRTALRLTASHSWVGAFGGNIVGEFETKPERWAEVMFPFLAIIPVKHEVWALGHGSEAQRCSPCGAGMVIRKVVATYYAKISANDPLRRGLDRKGVSLISAGDIDMALCSCVLALAIGRFPQLQMTHLISTRRLERDYLLKLAEGTAFSDTILQFIWNNQMPVHNIGLTKLCRSERLFQAYKTFRNRFRKQAPRTFGDEFKASLERGVSRAVQVLQAQQSCSPGKQF